MPLLNTTATVRILIILSAMVAISFSSMAQESEEEFKPSIRGAVMMANSHVPTATVNGADVVIIPTWGLDVDYVFHRRWSVAIQTDIKLQSFEVEDEGATIERSYPVALAAVIHYRPLTHWSFFTGPGYEFEKTENLFLFKLGTEYSFEITENFEIALNLIFENKQDVYDSWTFGVAFNKKLWERN